jgi:hypothetical protein
MARPVQKFFGLSEAARALIGNLPGYWYPAVGRSAVRVEYNRRSGCGWFARVYLIEPPAAFFFRNVLGFYKTPTLAAEAGRLVASCPRWDEDTTYLCSPQDIDDVRRSRGKVARA